MNDAGGPGGAAGSAGSGGSGNTAGSGGSGSEPFEPPLGELEPGWNAMRPGGRTICSRGTPFQYFVRPGTVNRLAIEFRGGGGCWDGPTCAPGSDLFVEAAQGEVFTLDDDYAAGIRDHSNPENPIKDWHHVFVPYCTADVHWGDTERTYESGGQTFTIHHKGAVNVRAVLDWVYANLPNPEKIFVTGCSAGAYGSMAWAAHVRNHYTSSKIYQFADCGSGVAVDEFIDNAVPRWNPEASYPTFLPNFDPVEYRLLAGGYRQIGAAYPDMFMSMFNFNFDGEQARYFALTGGGDAIEWSEKMRGTVSEIDAGSPNFASFIAAGPSHCSIPYASFYSIESNGVRLVDWLNEALNDVKVENVDCNPECGAPP